ncbi:DUF1330 domain-containing protein [Zooshikella sp. RANM57]|uniref:DUF1330 domain-containing protein n=1 Tax=Zooshikella sp. RANM57 TaxID=3425863 RepID=UPI003D6F29E9
MKYYVVVEINITDPSWIPEYLQKVTKMVESVGGKYLARTANIEIIEGEKTQPNNIVIIEFPSKEVAHAFYESDEYQPFKGKRINGTKEGSFMLVAGEDIAKS